MFKLRKDNSKKTLAMEIIQDLKFYLSVYKTLAIIELFIIIILMVYIIWF